MKKKLMLAVGDLLVVWWYDAASSGRWRTVDETLACKPWPCKTAGFLTDLDLDDEHGFVTLSQTMALNAAHDPENPEKAANIWTIPMSCITRLEKKRCR